MPFWFLILRYTSIKIHATSSSWPTLNELMESQSDLCDDSICQALVVVEAVGQKQTNCLFITTLIKLDRQSGRSSSTDTNMLAELINPQRNR